MEDAEGYLGGDVLCSMGLIRSMLKGSRVFTEAKGN